MERVRGVLVMGRCLEHECESRDGLDSEMNLFIWRGRQCLGEGHHSPPECAYHELGHIFIEVFASGINNSSVQRMYGSLKT